MNKLSLPRLVGETHQGVRMVVRLFKPCGTAPVRVRNDVVAVLHTTAVIVLG